MCVCIYIYVFENLMTFGLYSFLNISTVGLIEYFSIAIKKCSFYFKFGILQYFNSQYFNFVKSVTFFDSIYETKSNCDWYTPTSLFCSVISVCPVNPVLNL